MKKVKIVFIAAAVILALIIPGCGKGKKPGEDAGAKDGDKKTEALPEEVSLEGVEYFIEQSDADTLLSEAIEGTGCMAVFDNTLEKNGEGYYLYEVTDSDGFVLDQQLAVNGKSGDIFVYLPKSGKIEDFENFEYFDSSSLKDARIVWDGTFVLDKFRIELVAADESSFEFTVFSKDEELISGMVRTEGNSGTWQSEDGQESISFKMVDNDTLQVLTENTERFSGQYIREK